MTDTSLTSEPVAQPAAPAPVPAPTPAPVAPSPGFVSPPVFAPDQSETDRTATPAHLAAATNFFNGVAEQTPAEDAALGAIISNRAGPYISNDPKAAAPELAIVNGVPHLTLALTKATKAHIAGIATLVTGAAGYALSYEPDSVGLLKPITAGAIVLGFAVLSWLGVKQATNLPKKVK